MWRVPPPMGRRWLWRQRMLRRRRWGCCGPMFFVLTLAPLLAALGATRRRTRP